MTDLNELLRSTDISEKFARVRDLFDREFELITGEDKIRIWLSLSTQQTALLISVEMRRAFEEAGLTLDFTSFLSSSLVSAEHCSIIFREMLIGRLESAASRKLNRRPQ